MLLDAILPEGVESEECFGEAPGGFLFREEESVVARAVRQRRLEYATVRSCARACLSKLGYAPTPLLPGVDGAPTWPAGASGSMTHCAGYCAAAVAPAQLFSAIGIDAEPDEPLPEDVLEVVSTPWERTRLAGLGSGGGAPSWDRLLFSAKEALYKAWSSLVGNWLDHQEAQIVLRPDEATFTALLSREDLVVDGMPLVRLEGRYARANGLLVTALWVTAPGRSAPTPSRT